MMVATGDESRLDRGAEILNVSIDVLRLFGTAVPDMLLLVDRAGTIVYLNRTPPGIHAAEVIGTSVFDYAPGALRSELADSLADVFTTGSARVREVQGTHPDGTVHWYAAHTGAVRQAGRIALAAVLVRDITEQRRAQEALRESEERYRTLVEHAPEAIVVLDVDVCKFIDVNRNACALFGMSRRALLDSDPVALSPQTQPDGRLSSEVAWERINEALAGGAPAFAWMHRTPAGTDIRCDVRLVRLPSQTSRLVRGSVTDVTRQRQMEEHLHQWQKLEALGQLAGGIAHDFNNILLVISGAVHSLGTELSADPRYREDINELQSATRRGATLTRQLLTFARRQPVRTERIDVNAVVEEVGEMLSRLIGPAVKLVTRLDPSGAPVLSEPGRLEQVVMNLVLNARDAMPDGGAVTISTARVPDARSLDFAGCVTGPAVHVRVADTGAGWTRSRDGVVSSRSSRPSRLARAPGWDCRRSMRSSSKLGDASMSRAA